MIRQCDFCGLTKTYKRAAHVRKMAGARKGVAMGRYILAHDLGTSGNKATLYDLDGRLCASAVSEYPTYYPNDNWVEQEPMDWWKAVCMSTRELLEKAAIRSGDVACVCFSGQMMGCLPVDRCGNPLRRSIIWADMRAVKQAALLESELGMETVYKSTGHRISPSYSARGGILTRKVHLSG